MNNTAKKIYSALDNPLASVVAEKAGLRIVRNPATADELTVETFWRIHKAHARFHPAQGFEGWARRIATHAALDWLRSARSETELPAEIESPAKADPAAFLDGIHPNNAGMAVLARNLAPELEKMIK